MSEELQVEQTIQRLMRYQSHVVLFFLLVSFWRGEPLFYGLVAGSLVAWVVSLSQQLIFRRLPDTANAHTFYAMMLVSEVVKWLVVVVLIKILHSVPMVNTLGVVVGFIIAYLSYFLLLLEG